MSKRELVDFEKYQIRKHHYEGILNEEVLGSDFLKTFWSVNGEGRAISAMIQLEKNGKIIKHRIWSYDSMFEWKRKKQHTEMMLEALQWITN